MKTFNYIPLLLAMFVSLQACENTKKAEPDKDFSLSDSTLSLIAFDTVKQEPIKNELKLTGKITFNEDKVVKIYPIVGGRVEALKVELGDYVRKGDVLMIVRSSEIADYENQLVSAQSNVIIAQKNVDVTEDMFQAGLASDKDHVNAKNELQKAEGELARVKEVLDLFGATGKPIIEIKAPVNGFVVEKNVTENMQFRGDSPNNLFTISDMDNIWVIANVYESDVAKIRLGLDARISVLAYPDKYYEGHIDKIFNVIDPFSKVLKTRIVLNNADYMLKPEMFANVRVMYQDNHGLPAISASAIIFDNNRNFVLVYKSPHNIEIREVQVEKTIGDIAYMKRGLNLGDVVISKGQLLVYQELN